MNKIFFLIILIIFAFTNSKAQNRKFNNPIWTIGTAKTIGEKELHLNLLYYSQYGLTNKIEIQSKPVWWYKFPNVGVKVNWWNKKSTANANFFKKLGLIFSSKHAIYYPTPLMNYIQTKNIQNIDFGTAIIPDILAFKNEIYFSTIINKNKSCYKKTSILTLKIGNQKALKKSNQNFVITDKALIFRQTSIFDNYSLWYIGIDYDSKISYGLNYSFDADFYSVGLLMENWIFEHKALVYWYMGAEKRIRTSIGYQFSYTNRPGTKLSLYPLIDFSYIIKIKKGKKNKNLFGNGILEKPFDDREKQVKDNN